MKFLRPIYALPVALLATAGCSDLYEPTVQTSHLEKDSIISFTASLSHTLVQSDQFKYRTCSQPPPDAAFQQGESGDVNVSIVSVGGGGETDGADESSDSNEVEMAGRTPAVLITRELFFRACEFSHNHALSKEEAIALYNKTLDAVSTGWAAEAAQTTVTIGDTIATTQGLTTSDTQSNTTSTTTTDSETTSDSESDTSSESSSE